MLAVIALNGGLELSQSHPKMVCGLLVRRARLAAIGNKFFNSLVRYFPARQSSGAIVHGCARMLLRGILLSSKKLKMVGIHAVPRVAPMVNSHSLWNRTMRENVSDSMGVRATRCINARAINISVTGWCSTPHKAPTPIGLFIPNDLRIHPSNRSSPGLRLVYLLALRLFFTGQSARRATPGMRFRPQNLAGRSIPCLFS
jgi:hypothetical protein